MHRFILGIVVLMFMTNCASDKSDKSQYKSAPWSIEKQNEWYNSQPWLVGCNFTPSTAINQLEMWQEETFDPQTIDRELSWAEGIGFNIVRVYLHDLVWTFDSLGFAYRIDKFLSIADKHHIKVMFVLLDDCWNDNPHIGKQPQPLPGVHNSGWVQCPGIGIVADSSAWQLVKNYVKGVIKRFGNDERVILWDLYNEPGNSGMINKSLPLLKKVFQWAREVPHIQPLTVATWVYDERFALLNKTSIENSDIISFHQYGDLEALKNTVNKLREYKRPLICSEYMARTRNSRFETHLPYFKKEHIGAINWGLVSGKTNTIFPWGSKEGTPEPKIWFHDIFRKDGTPFSQKEVDLIKSLTGVK